MFNCDYGERYDKEDNDCKVCSQGTYSFEGKVCNVCPENGICDGNYLGIVVKKYYWRANNRSDQIIKCEYNPEACLAKDKCLVGYKGELCEQCDIENNFRKSGKNKCLLCEIKELVWL